MLLTLGLPGVGWHTVDVDLSGVPSDLVALVDATSIRNRLGAMPFGELSMEPQICEWRIELHLSDGSIVWASFFDDGPLRPGLCSWSAEHRAPRRVKYRPWKGRR